MIGEQLARLTQPGPAELDVSQCPDLVPPLAAMAALRAGETTAIVNAARLRIKESDRLASVTQVLNALGAGVEEHADHLVLRGRERLAGGVTVSGHNDHRIAMMAAIAATRCQGPVTITGAECVNKSYPASGQTTRPWAVRSPGRRRGGRPRSRFYTNGVGAGLVPARGRPQGPPLHKSAKHPAAFV